MQKTRYSHGQTTFFAPLAEPKWRPERVRFDAMMLSFAKSKLKHLWFKRYKAVL